MREHHYFDEKLTYVQCYEIKTTFLMNQFSIDLNKVTEFASLKDLGHCLKKVPITVSWAQFHTQPPRTGLGNCLVLPSPLTLEREVIILCDHKRFIVSKTCTRLVCAV